VRDESGDHETRRESGAVLPATARYVPPAQAVQCGSERSWVVRSRTAKASLNEYRRGQETGGHEFMMVDR